MGNSSSVEPETCPAKQFVTMSHKDWTSQIEKVLHTGPTLTKSVILPEGVNIDDPRLREGVVVSERTYTLEPGESPEWPSNTPFECDMDSNLLPPCWGNEHLATHYAVYPDKYFPDMNCAYCNYNQDNAIEGNRDKEDSLEVKPWVYDTKINTKPSEPDPRIRHPYSSDIVAA